jgi:hypothetical protein
MLVMAGLLAVVLIAMEERAQQIADQTDAQRHSGKPTVFTPDEMAFLNRWVGVWGSILVLLMVVIFLAAWDLWATRLYGIREMRKIQADRRAMIERQAARLRQQRNGHHGSI